MLQVKTEEREGVPTIALSGELDFSRTELLERELGAAEARQPLVLVLDLSELNFIDSGGVRGIVHANQRAAEDGRKLLVVKGVERVHRVFEWTGLTLSLQFIERAPA